MEDFYGTGIEIWAGFGPNRMANFPAFIASKSYTPDEMILFLANFNVSKITSESKKTGQITTAIWSDFFDSDFI